MASADPFPRLHPNAVAVRVGQFDRLVCCNSFECVGQVFRFFDVIVIATGRVSDIFEFSIIDRASKANTADFDVFVSDIFGDRSRVTSRFVRPSASRIIVCERVLQMLVLVSH